MMFNLTKIVLMFLLLVSCDSSSSLYTEEPDQSLSSVLTTETLRLELDINAEKIETLQDIEASFALTNISDVALSYGFNSGCQSGFTVKQNGTLILDSRNKFVCTGALTQLNLEPGENKEYQISTASIGDNKDLKKGIYQLAAFLLENHSQAIGTSFEIK